MIEALIFVVFPFCMVFAAASDLLTMTIPNWISLLLVAVFVVVAPLTGMGMEAYGWHFAAGAIALGGTFGLFALGTMGGGDAKLISATALWMGFGLQLVEYLMWSAVAGGCLALAILAYRKSPLATYTGGNNFLRHIAAADGGIPYGIALAVGGLLAYPASPLMAWALHSVSGQ